MTSRERILAACEGRAADHVPLTTWCFGLPAPPHLRWERDGRPVPYWYSMRMEHLHTLPEPWTLEDDFRRVLAWQSLGVDDILDVSVPWSIDAAVTVRDGEATGGGVVQWWGDAGSDRSDPSYRSDMAEPRQLSRILTREYDTPVGPIRHAVRHTGPEPAGWVIQPDHVPLFEDFNIPRAVRHAVSGPADVPAISYLYAPQNEAARAAFAERMARVGAFAGEQGIAVQAWSAFGMDAVVWLAGTENAVLLAMDEPEAFGRLVDAIARTDYARTELALDTPGVDLIVQRGWYSSTDFWSPALFDRYVAPHLAELARLVHSRGHKLAYVMTTGVEILGSKLADAGVDVLYFVDPVQDRVSLSRAREELSDRMTLVGGTNALTLGSGDPARIREEVIRAVDALGNTRRFILHPVDALFPDTPWEGVEALIAAWKDAAR